MLIKWHGQGNPDSAWVTLQLSEYEEHLNMDGAVSIILCDANRSVSANRMV